MGGDLHKQAVLKYTCILILEKERLTVISAVKWWDELDLDPTTPLDLVGCSKTLLGCSFRREASPVYFVWKEFFTVECFKITSEKTH